MKKQILTLAFATMTSLLATAQVAVNTTGNIANSSAMLDVESTSKGMLVPRMTEAQKTAIASPATGLLVFQTDATAGFYFYDGTAWVSLSGGTGNMAINDLSDAKTDTTLGSVYLGKNAGASTIGGGTWDGKYNAVLGDGAFKTTTTGHESVAIGYKALELGTISTRNTAVGFLALQNNSNSANTAIGAQTLKLSNGTQNTALGNFALTTLGASGSGNVALGYNSGAVLSSGGHNIFLGYESASSLTTGDYNIAIGSVVSLASNSGSNQMNIGNAIYGTNVYNPTAKIGIGNGNNAPNSTLDVDGSVSKPIIFTTTSGYTPTDTDYTVVGLTSVTLPNPNIMEGRIYVIKAGSTGVTLNPYTGGTIDAGSGSITIPAWGAVTVQATGTGNKWLIIGQTF